MVGEWRECLLGDVIELKRGYDLPQQQRISGKVPLVSSSGVTDYHSEPMVKGPGVVTGRYGTIGQVFYIEDDFWPLNTTLYVRNFKGNHPRFISYFLRGLDFLAYSDKAAVPGLNRNHLHLAKVKVPRDVSEQRAIAHILGTLDDKIELNRRMSETLEAMARALFQSWFVDFDPVRAKMNLPSPSGRGAGGEGTRSAKRPNAPIPTALLDFARQLRRQSTDAEALLWRLLRGRQIASAKFRRQHSFSPYILDFYCHELKLAVELDGGQHNEEAGRRRDARRDAYLAEHGIRVLRFWNNDVFRETEAVLEAIYAAVVERSSGVPSPPAPLPPGEGSISPSPSGRRVRDEGMPAIPPHILDLFPDRLVDSELGEIPEGWEIKKLSDLCSTQYGYTASAVDEPVGPKFLRVTDINKRNWIEWVDVPHCEIDSDTMQVYALKIGDLVVARMADPGKSAIIEEEIDAVFASYLVRLKTRSLADSYYIYGFLNSDLYLEYTEGAKSGSVQANMNAKVIVGASLVVPPIKVMEQFLRAVLPLRQRLVSNVRESRTLATLRDALLPKLISGELRMKDAERFIKAAP